MTQVLPNRATTKLTCLRSSTLSMLHVWTSNARPRWPHNMYNARQHIPTRLPGQGFLDAPTPKETYCIIQKVMNKCCGNKMIQASKEFALFQLEASQLPSQIWDWLLEKNENLVLLDFHVLFYFLVDFFIFLNIGPKHPKSWPSARASCARNISAALTSSCAASDWIRDLFWARKLPGIQDVLIF